MKSTPVTSAVDFEANYSFDGMPSRRARVHHMSPSSLRVLTHEQLTVRRVVTVEVLIEGNNSLSLLGQLVRLVDRRGTVFDYEIKLLGENTLQELLQSAVHSKIREERRPSLRVSVDLPADYTLDGKRVLQSRVHQISASGLRILTSGKLVLNTLVTVNILFDPNLRIGVLAQVMRLAGEVGGSFDYGLKVVGDRDTKNALRSAVLHLNLKAPQK